VLWGPGFKSKALKKILSTLESLFLIFFTDGLRQSMYRSQEEKNKDGTKILGKRKYRKEGNYQ
jgi:hypothetical protein